MTHDTLTGNAGAALKITALPFDRRYQSQIIKHTGTQLRHDALNRGNRTIYLLLHAANFLVDLGTVLHWQPVPE